MPDYADVCDLRTKEEALAKRQEIIQSIMGHLRQCVLRTLSEKSANSRPFDSNTISSFAHNDGRIGMSVQDRNFFVSRTRLNSLAGTQCAEPQPRAFNEDWDTMDGESETKDRIGESLDAKAASSVD